MSTPTSEQIYTNLRLMHASIVKANGLVLQLMAHPKATANQIMEAHESMVRTHQAYREVYKSVHELLCVKRKSYYYENRLENLKL